MAAVAAPAPIVPAPVAAPVVAPAPVAAPAPAAPPAPPRKPLTVSLAVALAVASLLLLYWVRSLSQVDDPVDLLGHAATERVLSSIAGVLALLSLSSGAAAAFSPEHRLAGLSLALAAIALLWLSIGAFSAIGDAQFKADELARKTDTKKFERIDQAESFRIQQWEGLDWSANSLVGDLRPLALLAVVVAALGIAGAVFLP
jgi:hypothetical protein